ncbi:hypothetical protein KPH14_010765 [Odynerus spinipes]|uniref:Uncharacterized protein n=1 Tax=Odynerus spinipes TaxID=1348599 RepID=A0AAD9RIB6_9HYME|nr:hypothetical protein KPH14_010765 [Odynerus spinipes]
MGDKGLPADAKSSKIDRSADRYIEALTKVAKPKLGEMTEEEEWKKMGEEKRGNEEGKKRTENGSKRADGTESDGKKTGEEESCGNEGMTHDVCKVLSAGEVCDFMDSGGISDEVIVIDGCINVREGVRAAKRARVLEDAETDDSGSSATVSSGDVSPCLVGKKSRPKSAKKSVAEPPKEVRMPREEERGDSGGDAAGRMGELDELEVSVSTLTDLVLKRMERIRPCE